jgi:hypothetical protein
MNHTVLLDVTQEAERMAHDREEFTRKAHRQALDEP